MATIVSTAVNLIGDRLQRQEADDTLRKSGWPKDTLRTRIRTAWRQSCRSTSFASLYVCAAVQNREAWMTTIYRDQLRNHFWSSVLKFIFHLSSALKEYVTSTTATCETPQRRRRKSRLFASDIYRLWWESSILLSMILVPSTSPGSILVLVLLVESRKAVSHVSKNGKQIHPRSV